jgi:glycerol-3-phosphate dehydrogenase (NAD(P)+)
MKIGVIGAGGWGTALANLLAGKGLSPMLWCFEPELVDQLNKQHENRLYLTGVKLDEAIESTADLERAVKDKEIIIFVIPSHHFRAVFEKARNFFPSDAILVSATKGIETDTLKTMSQVMAELAPSFSDRIVVISGPSFAREVAQKRLTAITAAGRNKATAELVQQTLSTDYFRVYTHSDMIGAELGGTAKNVIAIASGICDGMELGLNTRAAIITRGLAEIARLGIKMGAEPMTFAGLAGVGDLVLTCTGSLSRNYQVGFKIGQGMPLEQVLAEMKMVAEGVKNAESIYRLSQRESVEMPITEQVYLLIYAGKSPKMAIAGLMGRKLKTEFWS